MGTAENKELIRQATDLDKLLAAMTDDIRWTIIGTSKYSGTMNGRQEIMDKLITPAHSELESWGNIVIDNMIAEGDQVVVETHATGRKSKTGRPYNNTYCSVYKFVDGKIKEIMEYCDTELITAAFGREPISN